MLYFVRAGVFRAVVAVVGSAGGDDDCATGVKPGVD